jgi:hypothetical protein
MKKNYLIHYSERGTEIGQHPYTTSLMVVDCVGLVVKHDRDKKPSDNDVRHHLIGLREREIIVQANSLQEALLEFYDYPECKTGTKHRAWELVNSERQPIVEYAGCEHLRMKSSIACAKYDEPTDNGLMFCVLDGLDDPPLDCPINLQKTRQGFRSEIKMIGGVYVKQYSQQVFPMKVKSLEPVKVEQV